MIYKYTCIVNNKGYIGQTGNLSSRESHHRLPSSGWVAFRNAIKKYGWNTFARSILAEQLTIEESNKLEEKFIAELNTLVPNGYNIKNGGNNKLLPESIKQKISAKLKGRKIPKDVVEKRASKMRGRKLDPAVIAKQVLAKTGLTWTHKHKRRQHIVSQETKDKMRLSRIGKRQATVNCPHCDKIGGVGGMNKWHFDNCKLKGSITC